MSEKSVQHFLDKLEALKEYMAYKIEWDHFHYYLIKIYKSFGVFYGNLISEPLTFDEYFNHKQNTV